MHAIEAHKWALLAELYGENLTQTLADNDEDYGPVFVVYEGINLPKISEVQRTQAATEAAAIYQRRS